jgi:hypothetical protein
MIRVIMAISEKKSESATISPKTRWMFEMETRTYAETAMKTFNNKSWKTYF